MAEIPLEQVEDRAVSLTSLAVAGEIARPRALNIYITDEPAKGLILRVVPHPDFEREFPQRREVRLPATISSLSGIVTSCLKEWNQHIVNFHVPGLGFPFQRRSSRPLNPPLMTDALYNSKVRKLAEAGRKLFQQIFRPSGAGDDDLRAIGSAIEQLATIPDLRITVTSDCFYAPWTLMYLRNDFRKPCAEGFWGYQHVIEHDSAKEVLEPRPFEPSLAVALHFDIAIDKEFEKYSANATVQRLLGSYETVALRERHTKEAFTSALESGSAEQVLYFCCHARAEGDLRLKFDDPRIELTDVRSQQEIEQKLEREYIEPNDIDLYLDNDLRWLQGRPVVFINACEGAKMNSIFYPGFAGKFLNHRASAVLGPHVETPVVFARDFAQRSSKSSLKEAKKEISARSYSSCDVSSFPRIVIPWRWCTRFIAALTCT